MKKPNKQTIQKMSEARAAWWARKRASKWQKAVLLVRDLPQVAAKYGRKAVNKYEKISNFIRNF